MLDQFFLFYFSDSTLQPYPIWKVEWFQHKQLIFEEEDLLAVGEGGILMIFYYSNEKDKTGTLEKVKNFLI